MRRSTLLLAASCLVDGCGGANPNQGFFLVMGGEQRWVAQGGFSRYEGSAPEVTTWDPGEPRRFMEGPCAILGEIGSPYSRYGGEQPAFVDVTDGRLSLQVGGATVDMPVSSNMPLWQAGETVTIRGDGSGQGPAFTVALETPREPTLTALPSTWVRSKDLALQWTAGGKIFVVDLFGWEDGTGLSSPGRVPRRPLSAHCEFPSADGRGAIPSSVLMKFPPKNIVTIEVSGATRTVQTIGAYTVLFDTRQRAPASDREVLLDP